MTLPPKYSNITPILVLTYQNFLCIFIMNIHNSLMNRNYCIQADD